MKRVVEAEMLASASPGEAERCLSDLARINRCFGGHRILQRVFDSLVNRNDVFTVLDFGAASGDAGRAIRKRFRNARVISADISQNHLRGTPEPRIVADAFQPPFGERSVDFVLCCLLLHHFSEQEIVRLIQCLLPLCRRALVVVDLQRHVIPKAFLALTRHLFGWTELTVHDGLISVNAGFRSGDLRRLGTEAGAMRVKERCHLPWFRLSMVAQAPQETVSPSQV